MLMQEVFFTVFIHAHPPVEHEHHLEVPCSFVGMNGVLFAQILRHPPV